jgi:hypothetical protein
LRVHVDFAWHPYGIRTSGDCTSLKVTSVCSPASASENPG